MQAARMLADAGALAERVAAQLMSPGLDPEQAAAPVDDWVAARLADAAPALTYRVPEVAENILRAVLDHLPAGDRWRADLEANLVAVLFRLEKYREAEQSGQRLLAPIPTRNGSRRRPGWSRTRPSGPAGWTRRYPRSSGGWRGRDCRSRRRPGFGPCTR